MFLGWYRQCKLNLSSRQLAQSTYSDPLYAPIKAMCKLLDLVNHLAYSQPELKYSSVYIISKPEQVFIRRHITAKH